MNLKRMPQYPECQSFFAPLKYHEMELNLENRSQNFACDEWRTVHNISFTFIAFILSIELKISAIILMNHKFYTRFYRLIYKDH